MSPIQVKAAQQQTQPNAIEQAKEPRPESSFRGKVCAAVKRVVNNIGVCSAYVAFETVGGAAAGHAAASYYRGENDTYSNLSMACFSGAIGACSAVAVCLVGSFSIGEFESWPEKTGVSSKDK